MTAHSAIQLAERLTRRRVRVLYVLAIYFLISQSAAVGRSGKLGSWDSMRTVDTIQISAWLAMAVALLVLLFTGGGFFRSAEVRAMINDEGTRDHRRRALALGFAAAMATCIVVYFLSLFEPVGGRAAIHMVMTVGIASALIAFATFERRALRDA